MTKIWTMSAGAIARGVRKGDFTAREATESALQRLNEVNGPINAVVQRFDEDALLQADAVDAARDAKRDPGPLAGVPVTIKVNVDQRDRATTNGLRIQRDLVAEHDSPLVANLRAAGAVIIGRTNTPAFSLRWFTRNSLHGHTRNPHDPTLTPGGSSGGAGAAVAVGIGAIAHGTDIAGSIRYPAYACGVHGLRPTIGRVPAVNRSGPDRHIGAQLMAVSGPLARDIGDLRLGFEAMAAPAPGDPWQVPVPLTQGGFERRAALTVSPDGLAVDPSVARALHEAAARLSDAGWQVDVCECPPIAEAADINATLWLSEFRRNRLAPLERESDPDASKVAGYMLDRCPDGGYDGLMDALQARVSLMRQWDVFLARYSVWLCPVSAEPPFPDLLDVGSADDFERVIRAQMPMTALPVLGVPAMTVTTNVGEDGPIGVQLVAARYREDILFAAGQDIAERGVAISAIDPSPDYS
ncbi:MAG: amidase family protein [Burkholderiaceae bacterium]